MVDGSTGVAYKTEAAPEQTIASMLCALSLAVTPYLHIILPDGPTLRAIPDGARRRGGRARAIEGLMQTRACGTAGGLAP